jgi:integrase
MGSIYRRKWKDKDGNIREGEILWIKYYRNGKPIRESTGSSKDADAKRLLKKREGEISAGKLPGIYFDRVRFDELAEDFLTDYRINGKKSLWRAEITVHHLKSHFEGLRVTDITTARVKAYIRSRMEEGSSNGTINRELAALKRMLNLGAKQTPPKVDRVPYIPKLKENNVRKGFFEHEDYLKLLGALPSYLQPAITFGYKTGWRKSEIFGLTWEQVDLKEGTVRLEAGEAKNEEPRTIYLDGALRGLIKALMAQRQLGCPYVFHRDGKPIKDFRGSWVRACREAELEG